MLHKILVPLDGSRADESALAEAERIAMGCEVHLAHVIPAFDAPGSLPAARVLAMPEQAEAYLESLRPRLHGLPGEAFVLAGDPAERILKLALEQNIDLITMCTHARKGLAHWWFGSVAQAVVRSTSLPVLLTRPDAPPPPQEIKRILVAVEGPADVLEIVKPIAQRTHAEIALLHVESDVHDHSPQFKGDTARMITHDPRRKLQELADALEGEGLTAWPVITKGDAATAILERAHALGAGLIAMTTSAPQGLQRALLGSVAEKVVRGAACGILLLKTGVLARKR